MQARGMLAVVVLGSFLAVPSGSILAGGMGSAQEEDPYPVWSWKADVEAPQLAPNDYVESLESQEGIETGELTFPDVEPTVVPGPSEIVEIPEGG